MQQHGQAAGHKVPVCFITYMNQSKCIMLQASTVARGQLPPPSQWRSDDLGLGLCSSSRVAHCWP